MRLALVALLLSGCATTKPPPPPRELPEDYLDCKKRYGHYRCCPRDFKTDKVIGECFNLPRD